MTPLWQTKPLTIIDLPADARHTGALRPLSQIRFLMWHSTEGSDSRAWLTKTSDPVASAHRLIRRDAGEHYKLLPDSRVSYNCGYGTLGNYGPGNVPNLNDVTLSVELERQGSQGYTDWQYSELAALTVEWWGLYGPLPILLHRQVDPGRRSDPVNFDWDRASVEIAACLRDALGSGGVSPALAQLARNVKQGVDQLISGMGL